MPYIIGEKKPFGTAESINAVLTREWIEAASGAVDILEPMGLKFSIVITDMRGNIQKIRDKYETDKEKFEKFIDVMEYEKEHKEDKKDNSATVGGLWLKRGLEYFCEIFWELIQEHDASKQPGGKSDREAVQVACKKAYDRTLKNYHTLAIKRVVTEISPSLPNKETLMATLSKGEIGKEDEVVEEMKAYEAPLRAFLVVLGQLYKEMGHTDG